MNSKVATRLFDILEQQESAAQSLADILRFEGWKINAEQRGTLRSLKERFDQTCDELRAAIRAYE